MRIAVVTGHRGGMLFNRRRQSRDRVLCSKLLGIAGPGKLRIAPESAVLFEFAGDDIYIGDDFVSGAGPEDLCFVEDPKYLAGIQPDKLYLFNWNREYPADVNFPGLKALGFSGEPSVTAEFSGYSHRWIAVRDADAGADRPEIYPEYPDHEIPSAVLCQRGVYWRE